MSIDLIGRRPAMPMALLAVMLVAAGLLRIGLHVSATGLFALPICGPDGSWSLAHLLFVGDVAVAQAPHCWGCPAVIAGGALGLAALIVAALPRAPRGGTRPSAALAG